jgi:hydrogenase maturation factor HypE
VHQSRFVNNPGHSPEIFIKKADSIIHLQEYIFQVYINLNVGMGRVGVGRVGIGSFYLRRAKFKKK